MRRAPAADGRGGRKHALTRGALLRASVVARARSNNMLYPEERLRPRRHLVYKCKFCLHMEQADDPCVSRTVLKQTAEYAPPAATRLPPSARASLAPALGAHVRLSTYLSLQTASPPQAADHGDHRPGL